MSHYQRELYPDIEDLTLQELQNNPVLLAQGTERQYRYVPACDRSYRKPPLHFSIEITRCDGNPHLKTLHPGSIFEGFVSISVESALAAQHIKLIFRAAGKVEQIYFFFLFFTYFYFCFFFMNIVNNQITLSLF
jgi:hypothetical protein